MHLQQTKVDSRATGGPQYYFHELPVSVKEFIRRRGSCPVVLQTPYGITNSPFLAVGRDHKLNKKEDVVKGKVGHDRIQAAHGRESIGESIRFWYGLKTEPDFERIDVEVIIHPEGHFIVTPTSVLMRGGKRSKILEKIASPLAFHRDYHSKSWKSQIATVRKECADDISWAGSQLRRIVNENRHVNTRNVNESDLLRAAGALSLLGMNLSPYLTSGYDCPETKFCFSGLPSYPCPVEIKKRSCNFSYQITRYTQLPRAVVLCMKHDLVNTPDHIDVLELSSLAEYLCP